MSGVLELIRKCEKSGVKMSISGHNLKVDAPANLPDSVKDALRRHKADIIRTLTQKPSANISLTQRLNRMIAAGASFDVDTDDFHVVGAESLTNAEKEFLETNKPAILCTLQQCALKKYLSLSDLQMFIYQFKERAAVISCGETLEPTFEIISTATGEWFADLLDEMFDTTTNT